MQRKAVVLTAVGLGALLLGRMIVNKRRNHGLSDAASAEGVNTIGNMGEDSFPASDAPSFTPVHTP